jgi:hypothetical protein
MAAFDAAIVEQGSGAALARHLRLKHAGMVSNHRQRIRRKLGLI